MACRTKQGDSFLAYAPNTTVKGGVLRVIDSAEGDIARTTTGIIEDEKYGWRVFVGSSASAEFDSLVTRTGRLTLKFSTTNTGSYIEGYSSENPLTVPGISKYLFPIKPSTNYVFTYWMKTNYVSGDATNGATLTVGRFSNSSASAVGSSAGTYIKTTTDWTKYELSFTSESNASFLKINPRIYGHQGTATLIMDAWFDVNSMTLEEVTTITNPSSIPALLYPKATAVTSVDNIDQSQVTSNDSVFFGQTNSVYFGQQVLPTKKVVTGFSFRRDNNNGTLAQNITLTFQADNSGVPSGIDLVTPITITPAQWNAFTYNVDTPLYFSSPVSISIGASTKYWFIFKVASGDDSNCPKLRRSSADTYANGLTKIWNGSTWSADMAKDIVFQTLYGKNTDNFTVRLDGQDPISVTAPTTDGWADGTVIDTATLGIAPLVLAPGANTVYVSSNGPAIADGEVDPSMQVIISNQIYNQGRTKATSRSKTTTRNKSVLRDKTC